MKIVIASDSFKESLSSERVNTIIENVIKEMNPNIDVTKVSIADGGEGTVDAIINSIPSETFLTEVTSANKDKKIVAKWAKINDDKDAIMEVASVVGLDFLPSSSRDPFHTTTYGIGELLKTIMDHGVSNIYIGLGGSSTNDGGAGAIQALGVSLLDQNYKNIPLGGFYLSELRNIDISKIDSRIKNINFTLLSDVENVLCGEEGASKIFAPQKGATPEQAEILDKALMNYKNIIKKDLNIDISSLKGGGAAGGIGAGFYTFLKAEMKSGIKSLLDLISFNKIINDADLIITGEGRIDKQTKYGKAISGISEYAKAANKPIIAVCGLLEGDKETIKQEIQLKEIFHVVDKTTTKEMSMSNPEKFLYRCLRSNISNLF